MYIVSFVITAIISILSSQIIIIKRLYPHVYVEFQSKRKIRLFLDPKITASFINWRIDGWSSSQIIRCLWKSLQHNHMPFHAKDDHVETDIEIKSWVHHTLNALLLIFVFLIAMLCGRIETQNGYTVGGRYFMGVKSTDWHCFFRRGSWIFYQLLELHTPRAVQCTMSAADLLWEEETQRERELSYQMTITFVEWISLGFWYREWKLKENDLKLKIKPHEQ